MDLRQLKFSTDWVSHDINNYKYTRNRRNVMESNCNFNNSINCEGGELSDPFSCSFSYSFSCLCDKWADGFLYEGCCWCDIFAAKRIQLSIWVTYNVKICNATDRAEIQMKAGKVKEKMSLKDVIRKKKLLLGDKKHFFLLTIAFIDSLCINSD